MALIENGGGQLHILLAYLGRRGGGAIYSLEIARALKDRCQVTALVSEQALNLAQWQESGVELTVVPTYRNTLEFCSSYLWAPAFRTLARRINSISPDLIYYPMIHPWIPRLNRLLPGLPKVYTAHDPVLHLGERNWFLRRVQKQSIQQANRVIILSRAFVPTMEKLGVPRHRIDVIPHGEFSFYREVGTGSGGEHRGARLLFFGRIHEYKGVGVLLEAYREIKAQLPHAELVIAGEGDLGPYGDQLAKLEDVEVRNYWIEDEQVAALFANADLLVLPYLDASQSGVIPIAYSFAVPVVATSAGGLAEQVEHGRTGLLVPPNNSGALAEAVLSLLQDPPLRAKLGQAGGEKAQREWSWDLIAQRVLASCQRAAGDFRQERDR